MVEIQLLKEVEIMTRQPAGKMFPLDEKTDNWYLTYCELARGNDCHVLLESGRGGRYSVIGLSPWASLKGKDQVLTVTTRETVKRFDGPLLESLRRWMKAYKTNIDPELPDVQGGLIGQWSYDLIRQIETLPDETADDLQTDDLHLLAFDELYVIDHKMETLWLIVITDESDPEPILLNMEGAWGKAEARVNDQTAEFSFAGGAPPKASSRRRSFDKKTFTEAVRQVQQYIRDGDVFQVNLSVRESEPLTVAPMHIYKWLRAVNPSPYMGYFATPETVYISASPELLVKVKGDEISTRPIAGTRSRGKDEQDDVRLAETLINNEKERAEHIMLVDLERNDLGRVSRYGSVHVDELMVIEKYSHVMHIVSNIRGVKAADKDAIDVLKAAFPGGTITGAPKIRTMEIIEELEPVRRGAYTGAFGWLGFNGDMELNITIRTMVIKDKEVHVQAGAGIVVDSNPEAEYKESLKKAKALWYAKEKSEEELLMMKRRAEEEVK
ncbi:para-aminobenzoate synthetase component 1 [Salisediminibacterium halotolerans]|uniref:Para-aminobenzoate synthetase component 1 n=2 Tax=Salisediminibacterium halotolerans TaxID=517425 RepID=A0A1H9VSN1_9BACI|nr:para-aminobenzoate synthetase component 1 [Salisediminibacterium haloalkalitolerans]